MMSAYRGPKSVADVSGGTVIATVDIRVPVERVFRALSSDEVVAWWGDDIRFCIDTIGPSRCLFESNFPVDRRSLGYTTLWNAFQKIAGMVQPLLPTRECAPPVVRPLQSRRQSLRLRSNWWDRR